MIMEALPPTQGALLQNSNGALYQTSIWTTADQPQQQAPSTELWGWILVKDRKACLPFWTTLPIASEACYQLVKYTCRVQEDVAPDVVAGKVDGSVQDGAAVTIK